MEVDQASCGFPSRPSNSSSSSTPADNLTIDVDFDQSSLEVDEVPARNSSSLIDSRQHAHSDNGKHFLFLFSFCDTITHTNMIIILVLFYFRMKSM